MVFMCRKNKTIQQESLPCHHRAAWQLRCDVQGIGHDGVHSQMIIWGYCQLLC